MDAAPACGVRDEVIDQDDDGAGIFDDKPPAEIPPDSRKRGGPVTLITIGGDSAGKVPQTGEETSEDIVEPKESPAASEVDDENDDASMAETGKPVADSLPSLDQELANVVGSFQSAMKPSKPAVADSEDITHTVAQSQFSNFQTENTENMQEQDEAPAMQKRPERVVEHEGIGADVSDSSGEVTQEGEEYLDADGMPTLKLAKAMMPLFVKNYLLQILPSQQKAGNCALFVVKSGKMYMGRDINFAYLWEYAKKDGILPKDAKILPGVYDRLAKYWLQLNY
jgi:hypothetical protein